MSRNKQVGEVLDRCLARIQAGSATVEDCLRNYPELADQLAPLLRTALQVGDLLAPAGPTAAYRSDSEARLLNRLRAVERGARGRKPDRAARRPIRGWPRAWKPAHVLAGLALAVAVIASSVGVASAASAALPGDRLYGVKRGLEEVSLALSATDSGDAALLLGFAERRLAEAQALIDAGREDDLPAALAGYERALDRLLAQQARDRESLDRLEAAMVRHEQVLNAVLARAAPQARQAIERALEHSARGRDQLKRSRRQDQPADTVPPGQLKRTPAGEVQEAGEPPEQDQSRTPGPPPKATRAPKKRGQDN